MTITNVGRWLRQFWVVRLLVIAFGVVLAITIRDILMAILAGMLRLGANAPSLWFGKARTPELITPAGAVYSIAAFMTMVAIGFGFYAWYVKRFEQRVPSELDTSDAVREFAAGAGLGLGLILAVVTVLAAAGDAAVGRANGWPVAVAALAAALTAACMEELVLRGVILRLLEKALGTWAALALTAALFGALHATNAHATWVSTLTIAASGGLLLGLAYVMTRRLWLAIGLHAGVNAAQGALLGVPVSGHATPGLFITHLFGPEVLTGGAFGVEASIVLLVLALLIAALMARRSIRLGQIIPPSWRRKNALKSPQRLASSNSA
jgi:membrane protease YdiL (CAAX protease family)